MIRTQEKSLLISELFEVQEKLKFVRNNEQAEEALLKRADDIREQLVKMNVEEMFDKIQEEMFDKIQEERKIGNGKF